MISLGERSRTYFLIFSPNQIRYDIFILVDKLAIEYYIDIISARYLHVSCRGEGEMVVLSVYVMVCTVIHSIYDM